MSVIELGQGSDKSIRVYRHKYDGDLMHVEIVDLETQKLIFMAARPPGGARDVILRINLDTGAVNLERVE